MPTILVVTRKLTASRFVDVNTCGLLDNSANTVCSCHVNILSCQRDAIKATVRLSFLCKVPRTCCRLSPFIFLQEERRRDRRREQFARANSKFNNNFDAGEPLKMATSPERQRKAVAAESKVDYDEYEDPIRRQERREQELQKSNIKDQYLYLQNLRANALRMRNFVPPSDPLYDPTAPKVLFS